MTFGRHPSYRSTRLLFGFRGYRLHGANFVHTLPPPIEAIGSAIPPNTPNRPPAPDDDILTPPNTKWVAMGGLLGLKRVLMAEGY